jgi:Tfp pilus assembly protein PilO
MKLPTTPSLGADLIVLPILGLLCAAGYFLWIGPSLETIRAQATARAACEAQEMRYRAARANHYRVRRTLKDLLDQLEREGGGMPLCATVDQRIARMAAVAQSCGVVIEEVNPQGLPQTAEHVATRIDFRARGSYTGFRLFLRQVEEQMSFLDITHFAITRGPAPTNGDCQITWSVRMYSREDEPVATRAEPRRFQSVSGKGGQTT